MSRASRIAPAHVPNTARLAVNSLSDSNRPRRSRSFSIVVDSPPGRIRPSRDLRVLQAEICGIFTSDGIGTGFVSASACAA